MTLVMGPPGCGKSTFLKALAGHLSTHKDLQLDGQLTFNGDDIKSNKFIQSKVVDYCDEADTHIAVLTVKETLEFAWRATTGGSHLSENSMGSVKSQQHYAKTMDDGLSKVMNIIKLLGLESCQDTIVGDDMLKGISGGQKRRVTLGEILVCPRSVKVLDAISNGLDAATTFDINRSLKIASKVLDTTIVTSLLQVWSIS